MPTKNDTPEPEPEVDEQAAANALPPEPDADDPVAGPEDDAWRHPEPADEPKGYREAQVKEHDAAVKDAQA